MIDIRRGHVHPQAGATSTLLATPTLAPSPAGPEQPPAWGSAGAGGGTGGLAFVGSIAGGSAAAGCASAAFGGPADLVVLVALVAGLARLRPRDRARAQVGASASRRARGWCRGDR